MARALPLVTALALVGCWDFDFFDDFSEAGPTDLAIPDADPAADTGAEPDSATAPPPTGPAPRCDDGACAALALYGAGVRVPAIVATDAGGLYVLAIGLERVGEVPTEPAPSHLIELPAGGFSPERVVPLPFVGESLAWSGNAVYVSGNQLQAGTLLGSEIDPAGRQSMVARIGGEQVQWWITSTAQHLFAASASITDLWLLGSPAGELHVEPRTADLHVPDGPAGLFVAKLDGTGRLHRLHTFASTNSVVYRAAAGPGGHLTFAMLNSQAGPWIDEEPLPQGYFLAQLGVSGDTVWRQDAVDSPVALAVDGGGRTWVVSQGDATLLAPNGVPVATAASVGASLNAAGGMRDDGAVLLLGQTYGGATVAEQALPEPGAFVAELNALARPLWILPVGPASPNAPLTRHVTRAGSFGFAAMDVYGEMSFGGVTLSWDGTPYVAVLRLPQ